MNNVIITIGRESGSGGRYIGDLVSERLSIPLYDKSIIGKNYEVNEESIRMLADRSSCIILGSNSNNILKEYSNVINLFIYSNNLDFKIKRKMLLEGIDRNSAIKKIKNKDRERRNYYQSLNKGKIWGSRNDYDYLIDSSILGIEGTVDLIINIYNKYKNK